MSPKRCHQDDPDLATSNRHLAAANAVSAELIAELEEKNEQLLRLNKELARVNANTSELMAIVELKEEQIKQTNQSLAAANALAAELVADREIQIKKVEQLNRELFVEIDVRKRAHADLERAFEEIKKLQGILPMCCYCKKIRDDEGYWSEVEAYIAAHSETKFSHGICNDCLESCFPEVTPSAP